MAAAFPLPIDSPHHFFTAVITVTDWALSPKWYLLLAAIILTFIMALPEGEIARRFRKAIWALPILMFESIFSHILRFKKKEKIIEEAYENSH